MSGSDPATDSKTAHSTDDAGEAAALPDTFVQRGMAIHCTTPLLRYARVRSIGSDSYELIVPGVEPTQKSYVIPLKTVSDVVTLSVHDRALFEELHATEDPTPIIIRAIMLRVDETGLGGPGLMRNARMERERDESVGPHAFAELMGRAVRDLAGDFKAAARMTPDFLETEEGKEFCIKTLSGFASEIDTTGEDVYDRLQDWADVLTPVGVPVDLTGPLAAMYPGDADGNVRIEGFLVRLMHRMETLADELTAWLLPEPPDTAEMAQRTAVVARENVKRGRELLELVDAPLEDMRKPVSRWWGMRQDIEDLIVKFSYLFDGWCRIVDDWENGRKLDRFEQREIVERIAQNVPVLPREAQDGDTDFWHDLRERQGYWGELHRRRVGHVVDQDTRDRLDRFQKEPV